MGVDVGAIDIWDWRKPIAERLAELVDKLDSPHADKVYIAKGYTKADLRRDLLATIPGQERD